MTQQIDHFVWGVPDLEQGCAAIEGLFGVAPAPGGSHPNHGTCNALLALGTGLYLEIMAPDHPRPGSMGERLARLEAPGLVTWVIRSDDLNAVSQSLSNQGLGAAPLGPVETERVTPLGERLVWDLLFLTGHELGGIVPFLIDWRATPHPSHSAPKGGNLSRFEIASSRPQQLNAILQRIGREGLARDADQDQLTAQFDTRRGGVTLRSTPQSLTVLQG